jgi:hypothetical protein
VVHVVVGIGCRFPAEIRARGQVAVRVIAVARCLPEWQLAPDAPPALVVGILRGVGIRIRLRDAVAHFVVGIAGHLIQPIVETKSETAIQGLPMICCMSHPRIRPKHERFTLRILR